MQDQLYKEIILENWQNPMNYGLLVDPDINVEIHNPLCGDTMHLTVKFDKGKVSNVGFTAEGCVISKASASLFTEEIKGKSLAYLRRIEAKYVLELLEINLTPTRTKCALIVFSALKRGLLK